MKLEIGDPMVSIEFAGIQLRVESIETTDDKVVVHLEEVDSTPLTGAFLK